MRYLITARSVFSKPRSIALAVFVAWVVFTTAVWLPNLSLIAIILTSSASVMDKLSFVLTFYASITTNFTTVSAIYTSVIAVLFGIQVALLEYYIQQNKTGWLPGGFKSLAGTSVGGLVAGAFGIGCAACGTFILTALLTSLGASGFLLWLPFGGEEFGFLGVLLLLYSIWLLLHKIKVSKTGA